MKHSCISVDDSIGNGTFGSGLSPALSEYPSHPQHASTNLATSHTQGNNTSAPETAWMPVATPASTSAFPTFCNHCRPGEVQVPEPILAAIIAEVSRQLRQTYPSMNPLTVDSSLLSLSKAVDDSGEVSDKIAGEPLLFSNVEPEFPDDAVCAPSTPSRGLDELEDLFPFAEECSK